MTFSWEHMWWGVLFDAFVLSDRQFCFLSSRVASNSWPFPFPYVMPRLWEVFCFSLRPGQALNIWTTKGALSGFCSQYFLSVPRECPQKREMSNCVYFPWARSSQEFQMNGSPHLALKNLLHFGHLLYKYFYGSKLFLLWSIIYKMGHMSFSCIHLPFKCFIAICSYIAIQSTHFTCLNPSALKVSCFFLL